MATFSLTLLFLLFIIIIINVHKVPRILLSYVAEVQKMLCHHLRLFKYRASSGIFFPHTNKYPRG